MTANHGDVPYCGVPHPLAAAERPADEPPADRDERFTWNLVIDVFDVLEAHGYRKPDDPRLDPRR